MVRSAQTYLSVANIDAAQEREDLVMKHLPQVRLIAKRIHDRLPAHISLDDLISTGVIGLLSAIDNFDPSQNVQLNTYAERKIRFAILDGLREMDWVSRDTRQKAKLIKSAIANAMQKVGREPTEEEISATLKIPLVTYHAWLTEVQSVDMVQIEVASGKEERGTLLNLISDDEETWPSRIVERADLERVLTAAIDRMPKMERTVLNMYYYEELNLREIAEVVGMHLSRVAQIRVQAILRLRSHLDRVWPNQARSRG